MISKLFHLFHFDHNSILLECLRVPSNALMQFLFASLKFTEELIWTEIPYQIENDADDDDGWSKMSPDIDNLVMFHE